MKINDRVKLNYPENGGYYTKSNGAIGTVVECLSDMPQYEAWRVEWDDWADSIGNSSGEEQRNLLLIEEA